MSEQFLDSKRHNTPDREKQITSALDEIRALFEQERGDQERKAFVLAINYAIKCFEYLAESQEPVPVKGFRGASSYDIKSNKFRRRSKLTNLQNDIKHVRDNNDNFRNEYDRLYAKSLVLSGLYNTTPQSRQAGLGDRKTADALKNFKKFMK